MCLLSQVRPDYIAKLRSLESKKVVVLVDDSGSMNNPMFPAAVKKDPYARQVTRWMEMQRYLAVILDFATALSPQGCDVHFLNRPPMRGVTDVTQLAPAMAAPPSGYTPLVPALNFIWNENAAAMRESGVLMIVATDGSPTNSQGGDDLSNFFDTVRSKPSQCAMTMIAFTTDRNSVEYLDTLVG